MAKTDLQKQLAQARHEYNAEIAKLHQKLNKKMVGLLNESIKDLANALDSAAVLYREIPQEYREQVWREQSLKKALNTLGLRPRDSKGQAEGKGKGKRSKVTDEAILDLLEGDAVTTTGVMLHLGLSAVTVAKRLNALLTAGKVTMKKAGTSKYWKKA
jgi:hypothetical protein